MRKIAAPIFLCSLLFVGCVTLVEKTGQALDGSAFKEKKTAVYRTDDMEIKEMRTKAGERSVLIALNRFPAMKIRGSAPDDTGTMQLESLEYLGGNTHGWNEYRLDIDGRGRAELGEKTASFALTGSIDPVQISWGRIRRYDTRITGNDALSGLRNRRERILALTEWMNSGETSPVGMTQKSFEQYWNPVLFPEMAAKKKRPAGWQQEGDLFVKAEDINWNTSYTERVFPELLRTIRDSGTMLRDWEEALEWIYIEYEWSGIMETLSQETVLIKRKR
jgi:hypothetical protein